MWQIGVPVLLFCTSMADIQVCLLGKNSLSYTLKFCILTMGVLYFSENNYNENKPMNNILDECAYLNSSLNYFIKINS